ncbi:hypothetical protein QC763_0056180 [Podospora pseudopauciseta]|uniref:Uncharacterized protein n=2 Tax=Podospora TaxID=5144 RepID=A0ABR0HGX1_9PEZI|nr:hypothetical protein QC763_0056180 [Podospora pseudopauciseta]KAK4678502.1 hypothetical protein QC764_0055900 [Podospora pseudoanserina]
MNAIGNLLTQADGRGAYSKSAFLNRTGACW